MRKKCNELQLEKSRTEQSLDASMAIYAEDKSKFMLAIMLKCMRVGVLEAQRAEMPALQEQLRAALATLSACEVDLDNCREDASSQQNELSALQDQLCVVPVGSGTSDTKGEECCRLETLWRILTTDHEKLKVRTDGLEHELQCVQQQHMHCESRIRDLQQRNDLSDQWLASQASIAPAVSLQQPNQVAPAGLGGGVSPYMWWTP